ncbi:MAG TPA: YbjN domain-containing protein [Terriglobales bacterium]|nr:YbjN domain-containing protein [Terriglobales bacterium]
MPDEFIYPEAITADALKLLFEEAYMEVAVDNDGDLIVKDNYRCYLRPDADGRLISIYAIFGASDGAVEADKLAYINRVNDQVKLIRASVSSNGKFFFDYYLTVEGGISKRTIVMSVRRFFSCLGSALREDSGNVVA